MSQIILPTENEILMTYQIALAEYGENNGEFNLRMIGTLLQSMRYEILGDKNKREIGYILFRNLICRHYFGEANKRTAVRIFLNYLIVNNCRYSTNFLFKDFTNKVAEISDEEKLLEKITEDLEEVVFCD